MENDFTKTSQIIKKARQTFDMREDSYCEVSLPVIKSIQGNYYIAMFYSYETSEELQKNITSRPMFWEIFDVETGQREQLYKTIDNEFSKADYSAKYKFKNKSKPLKNEDITKICEDFDVLRKDLLKRKKLNVIKYERYLNNIKSYFHNEYAVFYDNLSLVLPSQKERAAKNAYQSELVKYLGKVLESPPQESEFFKWDTEETLKYLSAIEKALLSSEHNSKEEKRYQDLIISFEQFLAEKLVKHEYFYVLYNDENNFPLIGEGTSPLSICDKCLLVFTNKDFASVQKDYYERNFQYKISIRRFKGKNIMKFARERFELDGFNGIIFNEGFSNVLVLDILMIGYSVFSDFETTPNTNRAFKQATKKCNQLQSMCMPLEDKVLMSAVAYEDFINSLTYGVFLAPVKISPGKNKNESQIAFQQVDRADGAKGVVLFTDIGEIKKANYKEEDILMIPSEMIVDLIDKDGLDFVLFNYAKDSKDIMVTKVDRLVIEDLKRSFFNLGFVNPAFADVLTQENALFTEKTMSFIYSCQYMDYDDFGIFINNLLKTPLRVVRRIELETNKGILEVDPVNFMSTYRMSTPHAVNMACEAAGKYMEINFSPNDKCFSLRVSRNIYVLKPSMEKIFTDAIVTAMNR